MSRRLRDLPTLTERRGTACAPTKDAIPGLALSSVTDELVGYFGEGSESGLLVLKADDSWDPLRPGDVILRVNGAAATLDRVRATRANGRDATIEVLRRKRTLMLTLVAAR